MKVYIMRGLPGSGKDRWLETEMQGKDCKIFSADDCHINESGVYVYKPENAKHAHDSCFLNYARIVLTEKFDWLVVNNTNITLWELSPYVRLAEVQKIDYEIIQMHADPVVCMKRNVHGVPPATIWAMYQNLIETRLPAHYKVRHVYE